MDKANDYFTHDAHALEDPKCMMLVSELGMEGYGMFWALIESLRRQEGYSLPVSMIPALAQRYNVTEAKLKTVIGSYGLFTILDGCVFFSESLNRRMEAIESAAESRKNRALEAAKKRWEKTGKTEEKGLDLVEVAPNGRPPVCRIMNYGKYRYEQQKRDKEAKKKQKVFQIKEVKLRPNIEDHDFFVKLKNAQRFLGDGNKVKVTIMFRGREMTHPELGQDVLDRFAKELGDTVVREKPPKLEGRNMTMIVAPKA